MNLQNVLEQLQAEQEAQMRYELSRLNRELNLARDQGKVLQEKLHDAEVCSLKDGRHSIVTRGYPLLETKTAV